MRVGPSAWFDAFDCSLFNLHLRLLLRLIPIRSEACDYFGGIELTAYTMTVMK